MAATMPVLYDDYPLFNRKDRIRLAVLMNRLEFLRAKVRYAHPDAFYMQRAEIGALEWALEMLGQYHTAIEAQEG